MCVHLCVCVCVCVPAWVHCVHVCELHVLVHAGTCVNFMSACMSVACGGECVCVRVRVPVCVVGRVGTPGSWSVHGGHTHVRPARPQEARLPHTFLLPRARGPTGNPNSQEPLTRAATKPQDSLKPHLPGPPATGAACGAHEGVPQRRGPGPSEGYITSANGGGADAESQAEKQGPIQGCLRLPRATSGLLTPP